MRTTRIILNILFIMVVFIFANIVMSIGFYNGLDNGTNSNVWWMFGIYLFVFILALIVFFALENYSQGSCHRDANSLKVRIDQLADQLKATGVEYVKRYRKEAKTSHSVALYDHYKAIVADTRSDDN